MIREILFSEPKRRGTNLSHALEFLSRVTAHRAIAIVISDFIDTPSTHSLVRSGTTAMSVASLNALRQTNRRHDVVAVQIIDRYELELPALGRLILKDAETGQVIEVNTSRTARRTAFAKRQADAQNELARLFRSAAIDSIQVRTDQPYGIALGRFFETRERRRLHG